MPKVKKSFEKHMLDNLISKYKNNDSDQVVYRLSYAGKFIIIKGKTLCGSLIIIANTYDHFRPTANKMHQNHLYRHLYNHYKRHPGRRFTIKILAKIGKGVTQYELLKREQMELDKHRLNKLCLNNAVECYIPLYNEVSMKYGWMEKQPVMNYLSWMASKERKSYLKRYCTTKK